MTVAGTEAPVVCLDLDGVLWRGDEVIFPAVAGVAALRAAGLRVAFLSNNSSMPVGDVAAKLQRLGYAATTDEVLTSAIAAATLLAAKFAPGTRVLASAGPGVFEALIACGLEPVREAPADAVVVGFHLDFDFDDLDRTARLVREGAYFVATNADATYPIPHGLLPGTGALVAAVSVASGATPEIAGKPEAPMVALVRDRLGHTGVMVGDRPSTDGALADALGWPFALVLSGVTAAVAPPGGEAIPDPAPPFVAADPRWMTQRRRLDAELVRRGLLGSRSQAVEAITAGRVLVAGSRADAPARLVDPAEPIQLQGEAPRFVSRGGEKLAAALERFAVPVAGIRALDLGSSTGGFTDCLLQAGAASVVAVDVGRGQLAWPLRTDSRVTVLERTNARNLEPEHIGGAVELAVADLSFISLRTVAPALVRCTTPSADLVLLVKPQFEAGRARVGKGGIVRDPEVHRAVLHEVSVGLESAGVFAIDIMVSPLRGADGNVEFLARCNRVGPTLTSFVLDACVTEAPR